jgi:hypothetical protein
LRFDDDATGTALTLTSSWSSVGGVDARVLPLVVDLLEARLVAGVDDASPSSDESLIEMVSKTPLSAAARRKLAPVD